MGGYYFWPEKSLPASLSLWVDSKVMQCDHIILGGGNRSIKIKISPAVFNLTPNTEVIEGLAINRVPVLG
jgi:prolyl-tRNA editing enzyme YbaK/EbsC (Cys-tRNA(Pro) deacylase)